MQGKHLKKRGHFGVMRTLFSTKSCRNVLQWNWVGGCATVFPRYLWLDFHKDEERDLVVITGEIHCISRATVLVAVAE